MYKRILLFVLTIWCTGFYADAQTMPDISGSAMNSSTLVSQQRSAEVNVDLFTGIPQINVPLFQYKRGELNLNLYLEYFAGGVQVHEDATEVGTSWNLNAGGVIVRTLRGIPDDYPVNGYKYAPLLTTSFNSSTESQYYLDSLDSQADVFTYSLNGRTGKFQIAKNGKVTLIPQSKLKIEPEFIPNLNPTYTLAGFIITTEDGLRYEFKEIETSNLTYNPGGTAIFLGKDYPVAWHISRIITPFATDTIAFTYNTVEQYVRQHMPNSANITSVGAITDYPGVQASSSNKAKKVRQITLPANQTIRFEYKFRYDTDNPDSLLHRIGIYDNGTFKRGYRFDYYYHCYPETTFFSNYEFRLEGNYLGRNGLSNRTFLRRVMEETPWGHLPYYEFFYNNQYFLPPKNVGNVNDVSGASRDHWGFFNGKINKTDIPTVAGYPGGDREPSATFVLAGSLSKIITPEGTVKEYEFESNDRVQVNNENRSASIWASSPGSTAINLFQHYSSKHKITLAIDKTNFGSTPPFSGACDYSFYIKNNGGQIVSSQVISLSYLFYVGSLTWELNLPNGNYFIEAVKPSSCTLATDCRIDVKWTNSTVASAKVIGGGIRIKKITTNAGSNDASPLVTEYKYTMPDGITSSGYMSQIPRYDYIFKRYRADGSSTTSTTLVSEPLNNLGYISGNVIGYSRVEVIEGQEGSNNGKTVYEFTDFRDILSNQYIVEFPYAPVEKADWGLGLPKAILVYDNTGKLKKKTVNTYNIVQVSITNDSLRSVQLGLNGQAPTGPKYAYQWFSPVTGRAELMASMDTIFYDNGGYLAEATKYTYSSEHYNIKTITKDLDRQSNLKIERRLYYTDDYNLSTGAVKQLKDKGITKLIATEEWITGDGNPRMTGGEINDFQLINGTVIRPYKNFTLRSSTPVPAPVVGNFNPATLNRKPDLFKQSTTYSRYDNKGFLLQSMGEGGQTETILLSPDKQQLIARVQNAGITEIAYSSFESAEKGNWSYNGAPVSDNSAVSGKYVYNLSQGAISKTSLSTTTSFVLTLWAKNGTAAITGAALINSETNAKTGWTLYEYQINNQTSVTISGTALLDEIRLFPATAQMLTYTYEPLVGVTTSCDVNSKPIYYVYDALNHLSVVRDQNREVVRKMEYGNNTVLNTNPVWDYTGQTRCQQDQNGNTGRLEAEQININMNSPNFGNKQWTVAGTSSFCMAVAVWENTGNKRCKKSGSNNTGEVELEQKDVNPNSSTYGTLRWISGGIDRVFCPDLCIGEGRKIINGVCEVGTRINLRSKPLPDDLWDCTYVYEFSDGSRSDQYHDVNSVPCD